MEADRKDLDALRAALAVAEARAQAAETKAASAVAEATRAQAVLTSTEAVITALKLEIAKLRRALYGRKSERKARLLDQLELQLEELEAAASEDELAAEHAAARALTPVRAFTRCRPSRKPFPEHLPRERVVIQVPATCGCCGSGRIVKLGEDATETLEVVPRQWKVQTVRETFACRDCERMTQPPAPFHPTPRGWAGPNLEQAQRLNPYHTDEHPRTLGMAHFFAHRYQDAVVTINRITHEPGSQYWLYKAAAQAELGQLNEARAAVAEALKLDPDLTLEGEHERRLALGLAPAYAEHLTATLLKAGLPEGAAPQFCIRRLVRTPRTSQSQSSICLVRLLLARTMERSRIMADCGSA
jgi:hypothetical protein